MVRKLVSHVESSSNLAKLATESNIEEFIHLTTKISQLLAKENGRVGSLLITGKLIEAPPMGEAIVVGDLHGDLGSLVHILEESKFLAKMRNKKDVLLIFLGDYGDRGSHSPEVYYAVLKLKEQFPERVVLMRGNHEGPYDLLASPHDLPIHMNQKFGDSGSEAYSKLRELFNHLYTAVLIEERYVFLHGGAPSQATNVNDIAYAHTKHPQERHLEEILWSDPWEGIKGTIASPRGAGRLFGENVTNTLLKMLNVKALIRGHESSEEGYKTDHSEKVITLFSRKGPPYPNRFGAYLHINIAKKVEKPRQLLQEIHKF
ncbi:MAG: serine/threonine protein phosphatase [Candidatus Bathyarchaeum sp.]|nr:MAG: serine/threonine protein phosphatase [Candidatus Bathyarchaeum sp.]